MTPESELLRQFAERGDEAAFTELVRRYVDLVHSAALRQVGGRTHLAQDVAQNVFLALARSAGPLSHRASIVGWLYTTTRFTAAKILRSERRRARREHEAFAMPTPDPALEFNWESLRPVLDEAVCQLNATDREAVLLRFFQNRSHAEVGAALGLREEAARKRVDRALEKLRAHFARRGVTISSALLATVIGANSVQAAPAGLAATLSEFALAGAAAAGAAGPLLKTISMTIKTKTAWVAAAILVAATIATVTQQREITRLHEQLAAAEHDNLRSGRGQNQFSGQSGAATHRRSLAELQAKILAILKNPTNRNAAWEAFVKTLDPADFPNVVAYLDKQNLTLAVRNRLLPTLLPYWAKDDPQAALAFAMKYGGDRHNHNSFISDVVKGWEESDPEAAAAWWQQLPPGALRHGMTQDVISALADANPSAAFPLLAGLDPGTQKELIQRIFDDWGESDPAAAFAEVSAMPPGPLRDTAFSWLSLGRSAQDPQAALAWAETLPNATEKAEAVGDAISEMGTTDPKQAMDYVASLPPGEERYNTVGVLTMDLEFNDPGTALTFVQQLPDGKEKQAAQRVIAVIWSQSDPAAAMAYVEGLPPADTQSPPGAPAILTTVGTYWAENAPQDALAAVGNLSAGPSRDAFVSGVFDGLLKSSPSDAENLVSSLPTGQQTAAANQVTTALATTDPAAAAAWMSSLPEGVINGGTFATVVGSWAVYDPTAAGQWIQALPAGTTQDNAIAAYTGAIAESNPTSAAAWAVTINDPAKRNAAIETVAQSWLATDPKAAATWLSQTSLPADQQQKLLDQAKNN
jgi:RNA polymerase sigma factor (sigma-70 family)